MARTKEMKVKQRECIFFNEEKHCTALNVKTCKNCKFFKSKYDSKEQRKQQEFKNNILR